MSRLITALITGAIITTAAGCSADQPTDDPTTPAATSAPESQAPSSTEPAPSPPATSSSESTDDPSTPSQTLSAEQQAAADAVMEYFRLEDEVYQDNDADLQAIMTITDGDWQRTTSELISMQRADGVVQSGTTKFTVQDVEAPEDVDGETQIVVFACSDATDIEFVDEETGEPAEGETVVPFISYRMMLAERNGMWKIVGGGSKEVETCE